MILKSDHVADLLKKARCPAERDPFIVAPSPDPESLRTSGSASVDLRLGTWFMTLRQARMPYLRAGPKKERKSKRRATSRATEAKLTKTHYVPFGKDFYVHTGSFVLATTLEWIRLPTEVAAYVIGRSSWGRRGLIIATATGVHPGFIGCLTLELRNVGEIPIAIRPGMRICQLFLHSVESTGCGFVDQSAFNALRKPTLGQVRSDDVAEALAEAYSGHRHR